MDGLFGQERGVVGPPPPPGVGKAPGVSEPPENMDTGRELGGYMLGETRLPVSTRRRWGLVSGVVAAWAPPEGVDAAEEAVANVAGYMLGDMGFWRSDRSRCRFCGFLGLSGIDSGAVTCGTGVAGGIGGRERSEYEGVRRGLVCGRGFGRGLSIWIAFRVVDTSGAITTVSSVSGGTGFWHTRVFALAPSALEGRTPSLVIQLLRGC